MKCVRVNIGDRNNCVYEEAAQRIISGKLVAFPTETVYGLGGDGSNKLAVRLIFDVKRRPASDPVILHVTSAAEAFELWVLSPIEKSVIEILQREFWPGPVTIIAPASNKVPEEVTANTGRVAVRCPSHQVARRLIEMAGTPIAAPSANLFSRISPTRAEHVKKYFADEDLLIIECDDSCEVGIESTVLSVEGNTVKILRSGQITLTDLRRVLTQNILVETCAKNPLQVTAPADETTNSSGITTSGDNTNTTTTSLDSGRSTPTLQDQAEGSRSAPGQSLVHYAPTVTTYLCIDGAAKTRDLSKSAIIDMSGIFLELKSRARSYVSIKDEKDPQAVARNLFSCLHEVEDAGIAEELLICISKEDLYKPEYAGVLDRSIRAAAHKVLQ